MPDLPTSVFLTLRDRFFDDSGLAIPFPLRDKRDTQDDPFDELLASDVLLEMPETSCVKASGPLITPDMVLYRPSFCGTRNREELATSLEGILAIEVKKLERTAQGTVARASGLDFNTTPPCGKVRVFDAAGIQVDIRAFYLFVCLESASEEPRRLKVTALCLVDGNVLNEDFELYLRITGAREKQIGLGTYRDGADRARPMLIFGNPLGIGELDNAASLIHPDPGLGRNVPIIQLTHRISRSVSQIETRIFHCYRKKADVPDGFQVAALIDPFPMPTRETRTRPRGRFRLPFRID